MKEGGDNKGILNREEGINDLLFFSIAFLDIKLLGDSSFSELTVNKSETYVLKFYILKMTQVISNGMGKVSH